jgi:hypothetical protein
MKVQRFILLCHARQSMSPIECSKGILGKFIFKSNLASAAELILGRLQEAVEKVVEPQRSRASACLVARVQGVTENWCDIIANI